MAFSRSENNWVTSADAPWTPPGGGRGDVLGRLPVLLPPGGTPRALAALARTVALGLLSRLYPVGWPVHDKSLGEVLYAVAAVLALAPALPRRRPVLVAGLAMIRDLA